MKKHIGLTLVEIVVAFAILTMMAIIFISGVAGQYSLIQQTNDVTVNTFSAMGEGGTTEVPQVGIEEQMRQARSDYQDFSNLVPGAVNPYAQPDSENLTLFDGSRPGATALGGNYLDNAGNPIPVGIAIQAQRYRVDTGNGIFLETLATQYDKDVLPVPTISNVIINGGNPFVGHIGNNITFNPVFTINNDQVPSILAKTYKTWFTTTAGSFFMPVYILPEETIIIYRDRLPVWPRDYQVVGASFTDTTNVLSYSAQAGQHVVNAVYPAAKSGKVGNKTSSNSVFVSGLPLIANLVLHLDASLIQGNYSIAYEDDRIAMMAPPNGVGRVGGNIGEITYGPAFQNINRAWDDVRGAGVISATQGNPLHRPELYIHGFSDPSGDVNIAQYVNFEEDQSLVTNDFNNLDSNNFTMFVVARASDLSTNTNPTVLRCVDAIAGVGTNFWELNMSSFSMANITGDTLQFASFPPVDNDWNLLSVSASAAQVAFSIDGVPVVDNGGPNPFPFPIEFNTSQITIGGNLALEGVDIAEIIIYNNGTLTDAQRIAVNTYLNNKYQLEIADDDL